MVARPFRRPARRAAVVPPTDRVLRNAPAPMPQPLVVAPPPFVLVDLSNPDLFLLQDGTAFFPNTTLAEDRYAAFVGQLLDLPHYANRSLPLVYLRGSLFMCRPCLKFLASLHPLTILVLQMQGDGFLCDYPTSKAVGACTVCADKH